MAPTPPTEAPPAADSDLEETPSSNGVRRGRRLIKGILWTLVHLGLSYLVLGNLALRWPLLQENLRQPNKRVQVQWTSAFTWLPGLVHVEGLEVRAVNRAVTWKFEVAEADLRFGLLALLGRTVHIHSATGRGPSFLLRQSKASEVTESLQPSIPNLDGSTADPSNLNERKEHRENPWTIEIDQLSLKDPGEVWIGAYHFRGDIEIEGGMEAKIRRQVEVSPSRLVMRDGAIDFGEHPLAEDLDFTLDISFAPFLPGEHKGKASLAFASGRFEIDGRVAGLGLLDEYFEDYPWLKIESAGGHLVGQMTFAAGYVNKGSRLEMEETPIVVSFHGGQARGTANILAEVEPVAGKMSHRLELLVREAVAGAAGSEHTLAEVPELYMEAAGQNFHLERGFEDPSMAVRVERAKFPDLSFLQEQLPPSAGVKILDGSGFLDLDFTARSESLSGNLLLEVEGANLEYGERPVSVSAVFATQLVGGDLETAQFTLSESILDVESSTSFLSRPTKKKARTGDSQSPQGPWKGQVRLSDGRMRAIDPWHLRGDVDAELTDTSPIFALLLQDKKHLKIFEQALTVRDVEGTARVAAGRQIVTFRDIDITGDRLHLLGQLDVSEDPLDALLWAKFHGISAGLNVQVGKKDIQLIRPRKWYDETVESWKSRH